MLTVLYGGNQPNANSTQAAGIQYPYKNWAEIIRNHKPSKRIIIEHQPREALRAERARIISPKRSLKITAKKPRISQQKRRVE